MSKLSNNQTTLISFEEAKQVQPVRKFEVNNVVPQKKPPRRNPWGNSSYADLITQAIETSPEKKLTLSEIYDWMVRHVPYFKNQGSSNSSAGWKNSIRHNLSLHKKFLKLKNDNSNGKSSWWTVNEVAGTGRTTRRKNLYRRKKSKTSFPHKAEVLSKIKPYSPSSSPLTTSNENISTNVGWSGNIRYNLSQLIPDFPNNSRYSVLPNCSEAFGCCNDRVCIGVNLHSHPGYDLIHQCPVPIRTYPLPYINESVSSKSLTSNFHYQGLNPLYLHGNNVYEHYNTRQKAHESEIFPNTINSVFDNDENQCLNVSREYFKSPHHLSGSYLNLYETSNYKSDSIQYLSPEAGMYNLSTPISLSTKSCSSQNAQQMSFKSPFDDTLRHAFKAGQNFSISTGRQDDKDNSVKNFHSTIFSEQKCKSNFKREEDCYASSDFSTTDEELERISEFISEKFIKEEIHDEKHFHEEKRIFIPSTNNDILIANASTITKFISKPKLKAFYFSDVRDLKYILSCKNNVEYYLSFVHGADLTSKTSFSTVNIVLNYKKSIAESSSSTATDSNNQNISSYSCRFEYYATILERSAEISITNISSFDELSNIIEKETINICCLLLVTVNIILLRIQVISNSKNFVAGIVTRINQECAMFPLKQTLCYLTEFFIALSNLYYSFLQKSLLVQLRKKNKGSFPVPDRSLPDINCIIENYFKVLNQKITATFSEKILSNEKMSKFNVPPDAIEFLSSYAEDADRINGGIFHGNVGQNLRMLNIISLETLNQFCQSNSFSHPEQLKSCGSPELSVFLNGPPRNALIDYSTLDCISSICNLGNTRMGRMREIPKTDISRDDSVSKNHSELLNSRTEQSNARKVCESNLEQISKDLGAQVSCEKISASIKSKILMPSDAQSQDDFNESIEISQSGLLTNNSDLSSKHTGIKGEDESEVAQNCGSANERMSDNSIGNLKLENIRNVCISSAETGNFKLKNIDDICKSIEEFSFDNIGAPVSCKKNAALVKGKLLKPSEDQTQTDVDESFDISKSVLPLKNTIIDRRDMSKVIHGCSSENKSISQNGVRNLELNITGDIYASEDDILESCLDADQSGSLAANDLGKCEGHINENCELMQVDLNVLPVDLKDIKLTFDTYVFSENCELPSYVFGEYNKEFDVYL